MNNHRLDSVSVRMAQFVQLVDYTISLCVRLAATERDVIENPRSYRDHIVNELFLVPFKRLHRYHILLTMYT